MNITFSNGIISETDEKLILVSLLGIIDALKNNGLAIDEAEKILFSPYMINKLRNGKCNMKIIDILEKGCELEDIESLIPDRLLKVINELEKETLEIIKEYPRFNKTFWINKYIWSKCVRPALPGDVPRGYAFFSITSLNYTHSASIPWPAT